MEESSYHPSYQELEAFEVALVRSLVVDVGLFDVLVEETFVQKKVLMATVEACSCLLMVVAVQCLN